LQFVTFSSRTFVNCFFFSVYTHTHKRPSNAVVRNAVSKLLPPIQPLPHYDQSSSHCLRWNVAMPSNRSVPPSELKEPFRCHTITQGKANIMEPENREVTWRIALDRAGTWPCRPGPARPSRASCHIGSRFLGTIGTSCHAVLARQVYYQVQARPMARRHAFVPYRPKHGPPDTCNWIYMHRYMIFLNE